jgi:hypothetical protein
MPTGRPLADDAVRFASDHLGQRFAPLPLSDFQLSADIPLAQRPTTAAPLDPIYSCWLSRRSNDKMVGDCTKEIDILTMLRVWARQRGMLGYTKQDWGYFTVSRNIKQESVRQESTKHDAERRLHGMDVECEGKSIANKHNENMGAWYFPGCISEGTGGAISMCARGIKHASARTDETEAICASSRPSGGETARTSPRGPAQTCAAAMLSCWRGASAWSGRAVATCLRA